MIYKLITGEHARRALRFGENMKVGRNKLMSRLLRLHFLISCPIPVHSADVGERAEKSNSQRADAPAPPIFNQEGEPSLWCAGARVPPGGGARWGHQRDASVTLA